MLKTDPSGAERRWPGSGPASSSARWLCSANSHDRDRARAGADDDPVPGPRLLPSPGRCAAPPCASTSRRSRSSGARRERGSDPGRFAKKGVAASGTIGTRLRCADEASHPRVEQAPGVVVACSSPWSFCQRSRSPAPAPGGSFGGRMGFRSGGGTSMPRSYSGGGSRSYYGGGTHSFHFFPSFGWGGYGYGGGFGLVGDNGRAAGGRRRGRVGLARAPGQPQRRRAPLGDDRHGRGRDLRRARPTSTSSSSRSAGRRVASRSAWRLSPRRGTPTTESGLAALLQQTALELLREKDAIRYASSEARGPMSLTNAETAMNGVALAERSRFQVERVARARTGGSAVDRRGGGGARGAGADRGHARGRDPRAAAPVRRRSRTEEQLATLLAELGRRCRPSGLLGMEVVWTPADSNDSMTETDVMTTYPGAPQPLMPPAVPGGGRTDAASASAGAKPPLWRLTAGCRAVRHLRHRPADHRLLPVGADHTVQPPPRDPREQNVAVAIVVAAFIIGMAIIIAAALILIK